MTFQPELPNLPPGYMPLETLAVVKCLDESGELVLVTRQTEGLTPWETLGMLVAATEAAGEEMAECWEPEDDDEAGTASA